VIAIAALATLGAVAFAERGRGPARAALLTALVLGCLAVTNGAFARAQAPLLSLRWVKGVPRRGPCTSAGTRSRGSRSSEIPTTRPRVRLGPERPDAEGREGAAAAAPHRRRSRDAHHGVRRHARPLEFLRYDVTNVAHWIRRDARVLVIGPGGGRDVLSALLFAQRSVVGVEINGAIIDTVTRTYGDFTGHLDRDPR